MQARVIDETDGPQSQFGVLVQQLPDFDAEFPRSYDEYSLAEPLMPVGRAYRGVKRESRRHQQDTAERDEPVQSSPVHDEQE